MSKSEYVYICVGAQRSATTWIYRTLSELEGVTVPVVKEIDYFRRLGNYQKGLEWYFANFNQADLQLDITPEYAVSNESIELIHQDLGERAKLLFIVRDPIERLVSAYQKHMRNGDLVCNFDFFIKYNIDHCVDRSLYFSTIRRIEKHYQPTVLVYEDLKSDPDAWLEGVNSFFDVKISPEKSNNKFNPSSGLSGFRGVLNKIYRLAPWWVGLRKLKEFIEGSARGNALLYGGKEDVSEYYNKIRNNNELMAMFARDEKNVSEYLGRNLGQLWKL
jgi:hypothetical protein